MCKGSYYGQIYRTVGSTRVYTEADGGCCETSWQCTEFANRYFYAETGHLPVTGNGRDIVANIASKHYSGLTASAVTDVYSSSIQPGAIMSMWGASGPGHVAVVQSVSVSNGTGAISLVGENQGQGPVMQVPVVGGRLAYADSVVGSFTHYQWLTGTNLTSMASPTGHVDAVSTDRAGYLHVRGWAFDEDAPTASISVDVYIGGPAGKGDGHRITANTSRPDVGKAYPGTGSTHGFDAEVATAKYGQQPVYVYAINRSGTGGTNVLLGSSSVWITPTPYVGTHWETVGTHRLKRISLGPTGILWGVASRGGIFQYAGGGRWTRRGTGFKDVAVGLPSDATTGGPQVYALKTNGSVMRWRTGHWEPVRGRFATIDFGPLGDLWAVSSGGGIFQYAGGGKWTRRGNGFIDVTAGVPLDVASGGPRIYAVKSDGTVVRWRTDHWEPATGHCARVDFGDGELWGVGKTGVLWQYAGGGKWSRRGRGFSDVAVGMPGDGVGSPRVYALTKDGHVRRWRA